MRKHILEEEWPDWIKPNKPQEALAILKRWNFECQLTGVKRGLVMVPFDAIPKGHPWEPWNTVVVSRTEYDHIRTQAGKKKTFRVWNIFTFNETVAKRVAEAKAEAERRKGETFPVAIGPSEEEDTTDDEVKEGGDENVETNENKNPAEIDIPVISPSSENAPTPMAGLKALASVADAATPVAEAASAHG
jgi:hypothetical protein